MAGFATGFNNPTLPGFWLENLKYKVQFRGVRCDNASNHLELAQAFGLQCCYNWGEVIKLVLGATEKAANDSTVDIEEAAEEALRDWMTSFQGWGLLTSLVPSASIKHIVLSLELKSQTWDADKQGKYQEEEVFNTVRQIYDRVDGKEIKRSLPKIAIWFEEIVTGGEESERKKNLTIWLSGRWELEVLFVVEKKRVNRNLVELAAETLVRSIYSEEEVEKLEVPRELLDTVKSKFRDAEWVRDYWRLKADLEESVDESLGRVIEKEIYRDLGGHDIVSEHDDKNILENKSIQV